MATPTEDFVAAWLSPFLQSIKAMLSFPDTPRLACFVMQTGHLVFYKDGVFTVSDPDAEPADVEQKLRDLLVLTAPLDTPTGA